jgi:hypothetical protein
MHASIAFVSSRRQAAGVFFCALVLLPSLVVPLPTHPQAGGFLAVVPSANSIPAGPGMSPASWGAPEFLG